MFLAFVVLFGGGLLLGGAWSFYRSKKPWWSIVGLALLGLVCVGLSIWRIQAG